MDEAASDALCLAGELPPRHDQCRQLADRAARQCQRGSRADQRQHAGSDKRAVEPAGRPDETAGDDRPTKTEAVAAQHEKGKRSSASAGERSRSLVKAPFAAGPILLNDTAIVTRTMISGSASTNGIRIPLAVIPRQMATR